MLLLSFHLKDGETGDRMRAIDLAIELLGIVNHWVRELEQ